jgi:hypothetical protein
MSLKTCHNNAGPVRGDWMSLVTLKAKAANMGQTPIQNAAKRI